MPESVVYPHHEHMARDSRSQSVALETNGQGDPPELRDTSSPRSSSRDDSWLQVEVCRDFRRDTCPRGEECRFAHPDAKVMGRDGKVTCCYDFLKVSLGY